MFLRYWFTMRNRFFPVLILLFALSPRGDIVSKPIVYQHGDTVLELARSILHERRFMLSGFTSATES